eukprot:CAMPEP_0174950928 /NCGR_PEP_ID=MMETSP1355-20121228/94584_1 /TAXON_ID=464990 /ORGANISM="Hemiselmis tepida, Strain CCMP443" /LENGTH=245 /DNA_ID=CAMNT_0016198565 /DNA_START=344 /DNA_END=1078 /DNA_ORIENTATION=-
MNADEKPPRKRTRADPITFQLFRKPVVAPSGETYDLTTLGVPPLPGGGGMGSPAKETLEEEFSTDAPEHLLDPITFQLFRKPVVAPSGETYDLTTLQRTKNDPLTREELPHDLSALPVNRALKRQVDAFVQQKLEGVASNAGKDLPAALACLRLALGRTDDSCLNGTRAILQSLREVGPGGMQRISLREQQDLDATLQRLGEASLGEELLPGLSRPKRQPPPSLLPPGEQTPLSAATTPAAGGPS